LVWEEETRARYERGKLTHHDNEHGEMWIMTLSLFNGLACISYPDKTIISYDSIQGLQMRLLFC
jgi:hypothetical protein